MTEQLPILYVKSGCGWCQEAIDFLSDHGIGYREVNVSEDSSAYAAMERASGQTKAPVLDWRGDVLADFGLDELKPFLKAKGVEFEDS
jgi:glutaredoxin